MTKDDKIAALCEIIETLCVELKKDNSIAARRAKAKSQRKRMEDILSLDLAAGENQ